MNMFGTSRHGLVLFTCVGLLLRVAGQDTNSSTIMVISTNDTTSTTIQKIPTKQETPTLSPATSESPLTVTLPISTTTPSTTSTTTTPTTSTATTPITKSSTSVETIEPDEVVPDTCPPLSKMTDLDTLTQEEFISRITNSCRYDRLIKPVTKNALEVQFQIDMAHIESADHLQLKAHLYVQLLYTDARLAYNTLAPTRGYLLGEEDLRNKIWVPHIIVQNERESTLMGLDGKDVFVQISPEGRVVYSYRMTTMFYCWMNLKKFPFDHQICEIRWVSWTYNVSNLELRWDTQTPFQVASNLHLTEFVLEEKWCESIVVPPTFNRGGRVGNYSGLVFRLKLRREIGYYMMDYFLPSILLVCMSWVTFWLQADAAPPRVTLGTSTMLTFITLNGGLSKSLPKVSYIKASEIWFFGCASFIFFSLAEFAFVNVIWRRKKKVELKKQNSKHILKGALTPSLARKQLRKASSMNTLYKTRSCSSLDSENNVRVNSQMNYLTVHSFPNSINIPSIQMDSHNDLLSHEETVTTIPIPGGGSRPASPPPPAWTTMTPQEVAIWIDNKSRIVFPVSFLIFNLFYWSFVYAL